MKKILPFVVVFFIVPNVQAEEQKLSQAYEEQLIERVRSVFSLEAEKVEIERPICATPIFLEVKANWDRLSVGTRKLLQQDVQRPTFGFPEFTYDTPEGHFKIHYVRQGDSAVYNPDADYNVNGHPDWVDTVGMVLEHVWHTEINALGYITPPNDAWYHDTLDNGGDGKYDVYLLELEGVLGFTQGEFFVSPNSGSATSYIVLDNDYTEWAAHSQLEWLQVTSAHEFFHAIQMGYDGAEYEIEGDNVKPYWMEMSAVWMEEMVYDPVNDYLGYLSSFFNHPDWSLKTFSLYRIGPYGIDSLFHAYGSCVWPMYLQERFDDTTIIREIWRECAQVAGDNAISYSGGESATDKALKARGATFEEAFREFTLWNYFSGDRARTQVYYSEGDLFPQVKVDSLFHYHTTYPVYASSGPDNPHSLSSNYVVFVPDTELEPGGIRIEFIGHTGDYSVSVVGYKSYPLTPFVTSLIGVAEIYNWHSYTEVVMIPAVVTRSPDDGWLYEYHGLYDSSLHGDETLPEEDEVLQNYPNPFVIETQSDKTFFPFVLSLPSRVRVDLFTLSGERIRTIVPRYDIRLGREEYVDQLVLQELDMFWDGKNEDEEYISSGVYLYRFRTDRTTVVKKMAVIR